MRGYWLFCAGMALMLTPATRSRMPLWIAGAALWLASMSS